MRRLAALLAPLLVLAATAASAVDDEDAPVLLEAETVSYDQARDRITASGNVFLARGRFTLTADRIVYDRPAETVTADGDVVLVDDDGNSSFADRMELTDDLGTGFIEGIALRLSDASLLVARRGDREEGRLTTFRDVTYSPCQVCAERSPTWQINADAVIHDQTERVLSYEDATFELAGVPVLYTPFFSHPDPSVPRQSGFLVPTFTSDSELGLTAEIPYHWVLAPNRDVTVRPTFTTEEGVLLALDVRDLQSFGRTDVTLSGTYDSDSAGGDDRGRGHVDGRGRYGFGEDWQGGFDLRLASDDTYLRRFNIDDANVLDSRLFAQRIENDRFLDVSALGFQSLRPDDDQDEIPFALPQLRSLFTGRIAGYGAQWAIRPDLLALYRSNGIDTRRGSIAAEISAPRISPWGDVLTASASLRGDVYAVQGDVATGVDDGDTSFEARVIPRATFDWRRPYARLGSAGVAYELEPVASLTLAPTGVNDDDIPNEDSLDLEFDETNLLRPDRFPGLDLVDEGSKVTWGLRTAGLGLDRELWSVFLGQSYRFSETDVFESVSGLEEDLSDVVGRVGLSPHPWVDVDYRFRVDADFGGLSKSDFQAVAGPPRLRLALGHLLLDESSAGELSRREEGRAALSLRLDQNWSLIAGARRDLDNGDDIRHTVGLIYEDPCLTVVLGVDRDFTSDRDARESTTVALRVSLRNLGEIGGSSALVGSDDDN